MTRKRIFSLVLLTIFACALAGAVSASDAASRGYELIAHKPYQDAYLTGAIFDNLWRTWEPELSARAKNSTSDERRAMAMRRYGFVEAPYDNGGLPLGFVKGSLGGWHPTCLLCHAGKVAGQTIYGAPNYRLDLGLFAEDVFKLTHLRAPMQWFNHSRGTITSSGLTTKELLYRDKDLNWTLSANHFGDIQQDDDMDIPCWWNVSKKSRFYADGFAPKSPRGLMQFVVPFTQPGFVIRSWLPEFEDVFQWLETIRPPRYPGYIDPELAVRGRPIFEKHCASCHGTYGPGGSYPNKTVDLEVVGTDPVRLRNGLSSGYREFYKQSFLGNYGKDEVITAPNGYVAPPLDGIWASAPYFHNGSVPTLYHVLHPDERPTVWKIRELDGYDAKRVGLDVEESDEVPAGLSEADHRAYWDTRLPSKSNQGHLIPDELSEDSKTAVLEYLKTL